jgi:hypothetical protein
MKKITLLIALMITSLVFAQSIEGTWKLSVTDGLWVGSGQKGTLPAPGKYWPPDASLLPGQRPCQWDDEFVFNADGTFQNVLQSQTWLETWQAASEGCGTPLAPHNGSNPATYVYSASNGTLTLNGLGAFMGLPKAINGSEINNPANAASTITYLATLTETTLKLDILVGPPGGNWWSFEFTKKLSGQPVIGGINLPFNPTTETGVFDLADYVVAPAITNPSSDSPGVFSYTSSNPAVATITGSSVFIVGAGTTTITAIQAASPPFLSGQVDTKLIVSLPDPASGTSIIPPTLPADKVISIYNGIDTPVAPQYTNIPGVTFQDFGGSTIVGDVTLGDGNIVKKYVKHLYSGMQLGATPIDVSGMTHLHMDVYSTDFTGFAVKLEDANVPPKFNEIEVPFAKVKGSWNSYDIDLSNYSAPDLKKLKFIVPVTYQDFPNGRTVYIDNVYFYNSAALKVAKFDASSIKMYPNPVKNTLTIEANSAIQKVSVYNVLGQEVMAKSPKSNSTTLQTSALQKGVYMVKTEIDGNVSMRKIVKE